MILNVLKKPTFIKIRSVKNKNHKLSSEEKLLIDYEADKFKKDFNEELKLYRQRKAEGL